jgi:hypothetical protein
MGRFLELIIPLCALALWPVVAVGQTEAPFGLVWGQSESQVRALGVVLKEYQSKDYGKSFFATELPRALADQETAILSFGHDDKLWRIVAIGRANDRDPMGGSVKSRYNELREVLTEKYGRPTSVHRLGDSIYAEAEYFLSGIRQGKSFWYSSFEASSNVSAELAITASDSSTSRWRIIFEEKNLRRAFDASKKLQEKKVL